LLTVLGGTFATFVARQSPGVVILLGSFQLLGGLLGLIGLCLCCAAPGDSGLRPLAGGSLTCLLLAAALVVGLMALDAGIHLANLNELGMLGAGGCILLLMLAGGLLFFLFLRGVARHFGSRLLASECLVCGVAAGLFTFSSAALMAWGRLDFAPLGRHVMVPVAFFFCGGFGFLLILLLWLFSLFVRVRDLIPPASPRHKPEDALETTP